MFSSRLPWDLPPNQLSALLESKRRAGAAILDLTESNPTRVGLSYPERKILEALSDPQSLVYEPLPSGSVEARAAIAAYHGVEPQRVLLTASTSEAYAYQFKLLANPGDEVLVPRPSYPLFDFLASLESVRVAHYPLAYSGGWSIDFNALRQAVTERTRAIVVVHPNNPTGSFLKYHELAGLIRLCWAHKLALISDEVFADYAFGPDPRRIGTLATVEAVLTFCMSGLSKIAGLPQVKLGWIIVGGPGADRALERLELIADTYLSVGTPVQRALPRLLEAGAEVRHQIQKRVRENLAFMQSAVSCKPAVNLLDVEGGWYATLRVPRTHSEEEWTLELLQNDNVLVQPGFFYDFETEAFLVVSLLTRPETFREGIGRLLQRLSG